MRETKFRGWTGKKMHYGWGCFTNESSKSFIVIDENDYYPDPVILMQFTGLHDKDGKEIYEGDIFKSHNGRLWEIRFGEWMFYDQHQLCPMNGSYAVGHEPGWDGEAQQPVCAEYVKTIEVIGNIYENPELLK